MTNKTTTICCTLALLASVAATPAFSQAKNFAGPSIAIGGGYSSQTYKGKFDGIDADDIPFSFSMDNGKNDFTSLIDLSYGINVDKTKDIPMDYKGFMGVPITFLDKYNPEQFEIIGLGISNSGKEVGVAPYKKEHKEYRKNIQKRGAVDGDLYMIINDVVTVPYARIIIKNKKVIK